MLATSSTPGYAGAGSSRRNRIVIGVALSLAVHAVLLWGYRHRPAPPADTARRPMSVWLRPPPPTAAARTEEEPLPPARERARSPPTRPKSTPRPVIAVPARPERPAQPDEPVVPAAPAAAPEPEAPRFDIDAARQTARAMAGEPDPARAGTAVAQLPPKSYRTQSRAERAIGAAHRRDCKDGLPGGLLGPLIILMDKKDSGCKW